MSSQFLEQFAQFGSHLYGMSHQSRLITFFVEQIAYLFEM